MNFLVCASLLLLANSLRAENAVRYEAQPGGSKVKLEGTSSIHDWTVNSSAIGGFMEIDSQFDADLKKPNTAPKVEVSIPIRQLKSTEGRAMDNVMYEAMKQADHPKIEFKLLELTPKSGAQTPGGAAQFDAKGTLTIAGVTRTNTMPVAFEHLDKTKLKVSGTTTVKMTDFGIKPPAPTLAFGLLKTGDDVKITFEWLTAQKSEAAKAPEKP